MKNKKEESEKIPTKSNDSKTSAKTKKQKEEK